MIKTGLVSVTFRILSPREIVGLVCQAHQQGIEWGGDRHVPHGDLTAAKQVGIMTREAGLETVAYGSYYRVGVSPNAGLAFETVLETALTLQAPTIRVWAGNQGSTDTSATEYNRVVNDARRIGDLAAQAGLTIALEFHGGTLTDSTAAAVRLYNDVSHPRVRLLWQPPAQEHNQAVQEFPSLFPYLQHVHVFYWTQTQSRIERCPLLKGGTLWHGILTQLIASEQTYYTLLEFVQNDAPEQYISDAETLEHWHASLR